MVLQQKSEMTVKGKATPNSIVKFKASWNSKTIITKADASGTFSVKFRVPDASMKTYTLSFDDGDGEKTAEPQKTNDTVVEGSDESGRRQVTDYDPGYSSGPATNGSTESTDTSNREANGTTDSTGATVDNQINDQNSVVQQAKPEEATPKDTWQAGYTPPED